MSERARIYRKKAKTPDISNPSLKPKVRGFGEPQSESNWNSTTPAPQKQQNQENISLKQDAFGGNFNILEKCTIVRPQENVQRQEVEEEKEGIEQGEVVQAKSTVGEAGNKYEQEADRVAAKVVEGIQRDLVIPKALKAEDNKNIHLSKEQVHKAIRYNQHWYSPNQIETIQDVVGADVTGEVNAATVNLIAQYQQDMGLVPDGMVGPNSFKQLNDELDAEGVSDGASLVMFRVIGTGHKINKKRKGHFADMEGRFDVDIRLPEGETAGDYEYRQFICGDVSFVRSGAPFTEPAQSLNHLFQDIPGGSLPPIGKWVEDGDTSRNAQYGHRDQPARPENRYLDKNGNPDQKNGSVFESFDVPGLTGHPVESGELYDFDIRFRGVVTHKTKGVVSEKYWNMRGEFTIE